MKNPEPQAEELVLHVSPYWEHQPGKQRGDISEIRTDRARTDSTQRLDKRKCGALYVSNKHHWSEKEKKLEVFKASTFGFRQVEFEVPWSPQSVIIISLVTRKPLAWKFYSLLLGLSGVYNVLKEWKGTRITHRCHRVSHDLAMQSL